VGGGLAAAGVAAFVAAALVERIRGGERRFTGSRLLPRGGVPPTTTFFGEGVPAIDAATWRLAVTGRVSRPRDYDLASLAGLGTRDLPAILDCTSGWALDTDWHGTPVATILDAAAVDPAANSVEIRAVTGWSTTMSLADARRCLLATHVAGAPLPAANGAPARLVAPDRRGLEWVKWVGEIRVA
jgi:DMSO/TMAO reductase YedYZ molybdopterin-dependent catalytic subunit